MYVSTLSHSSDTPEEGIRSQCPLITDGCEPPCGCWKLNSGPKRGLSWYLKASRRAKSNNGSLWVLSHKPAFLI